MNQRAKPEYVGIGLVIDDTELSCCDICGSIVGSEAVHNRFHAALAGVASDASHAASMTRVIGGTQ